MKDTTYKRRKFDNNGSLLAEYQAEIFEKSVDRFKCSSPIFLRRYIKTDFLRRMDFNRSTSFDLDSNKALDRLEEEINNIEYGKEKYNPEVMYWMGYMYRYISFTRDTNTRLLFKLFPFQKMRENYYVLHTQNPEYVVATLLEQNNLTEDIFDKNYRLKQAFREYIKNNQNK